VSTRQQLGYWFAGLIVLLVALYFLSSILLPFIAGIAVAYFLDPVADRLERWRVPRGLAAALVLTVFFLLGAVTALLVVPVLQQQIFGLAAHMPGYIAGLRENVLPALAELLDRLGVDYQDDGLRKAMGGVTTEVVGFLSRLLRNVWDSGLAIVNLLSLLFITPIVAFYLLRDWDLIIARIDGWLPRQHRDSVRQVAADIDSVMAGFVRGQGTVCLILGVFYASALSLAGLDFGLTIGIIAGLVSFIPFVGAIVGLLLSSVQAFVQFWPDPVQIGIIIAIFIAGQALEGNFLTPRLLGNRVGLHPVWVMFGLLAGGVLFGFVGVLLAVPLTAAIGVIARFLLQRYENSRLYLGDSPKVPAAAPETDSGSKAP